MPNEKQTNNLKEITQHHHVLFVLAGFLIGTVVGLGGGLLFDSGKVGGFSDAEKYEALKQEVREQYPQYFEDDANIGVYYSGTVEEVKESSIVIKRDIPDIVLLASDISELTKIEIDENTTIIKNIQKSDEEYQQELAEYEEAYAEYQEQLDAVPEDEFAEITSLPEEPLYPSDIKSEEIEVGELNVGDIVNVSIEQASAEAFEGGGSTETSMTEDRTIINVQEDITQNEAINEDDEFLENQGTEEPVGP